MLLEQCLRPKPHMAPLDKRHKASAEDTYESCNKQHGLIEQLGLIRLARSTRRKQDARVDNTVRVHWIRLQEQNVVAEHRSKHSGIAARSIVSVVIML